MALVEGGFEDGGGVDVEAGELLGVGGGDALGSAAQALAARVFTESDQQVAHRPLHPGRVERAGQRDPDWPSPGAQSWSPRP